MAPFPAVGPYPDVADPFSLGPSGGPISSPLLNPQENIQKLIDAREAARLQSGHQAAALYRALALQHGGSLEDIPIGQGPGGGFLTLGGVVLRAVEAAQRRKAAEAAAGQMPTTSVKEGKLLSELDKLASKHFQFDVPDVPTGGE